MSTDPVSMWLAAACDQLDDIETVIDRGVKTTGDGDRIRLSAAQIDRLHHVLARVAMHAHTASWNMADPHRAEVIVG
ncbi:MAG: hypothetical protein F4Y04_05035 [Chloroflexi bacterium]|nr:hypothetical protein [Chloroflexota bacterium]